MNEVCERLRELAVEHADETSGLELDETMSSCREVTVTEEGMSGTTYHLVQRYLRTAGDHVGYAKSESAEEPLEELVDEALLQARIVDESVPEGVLVAPAPGEGELSLPAAGELAAGDAPSSDELARIARTGLTELVGRAGRHQSAECTVRVFDETRHVRNSLGLSRADAHRHYLVRLSYVAAGDREKCESWVRSYGGDLSQIDLADLAVRAVRQGGCSLDGGTIDSGCYPVVISREVACRMLVGFWNVFSASKVATGQSYLSGRLGERVASEAVSIIDDSTDAPGAPGALGIDSQGMLRRSFIVVDHGRFAAPLSDCSWAARMGLERSSGNSARREGLGRIVPNELVIAPANLYLAPGGFSLDELLAQVGDGIYLSDIGDIYHSFAFTTGGVSAPCRGARIRGGRLAEPIAAVSISDDLQSILGNVVALGDQLSWCDLEDLDAYWCGAPDMLVSSMNLVGAITG